MCPPAQTRDAPAHGIRAAGFAKNGRDFRADAVGRKYFSRFNLPLFCATACSDEKTSRFTLIPPKMFAFGPIALTGCKPCRRIVPS
jgi:hypothetical protein